MAKRTRITDRDRGYRALMNRLADIRGVRAVTFGVHEDQTHEPSGLPMARLLEIHELGLGVPRRSAIVDWADENEPQARRQLERIARDVVAGRVSLADGLEKFGEWGVGSIRERIDNGIPPPNAESTIRAKGSSTPLIDTHTLYDAITFKLEDV